MLSILGSFGGSSSAVYAYTQTWRCIQQVQTRMTFVYTALHNNLHPHATIGENPEGNGGIQIPFGKALSTGLCIFGENWHRRLWLWMKW